MSIIGPFSGIRYSTTNDVHISSRIAPPYDVLSEADKAALLARDQRNFVAIDLPHVPPKDAGPPLAYAEAARTLARWREDGTLVADSEPSLYLYYQHYVHGGKTYTRRKFFARLRLEPLGKGSVFPHEQTFGGPKEDRLALMKATRAQLSPIFGLYEDGRNEVAERMAEFSVKPPAAVGNLDGVESRMWRISDEGAIGDVRRMMESRPIFIADGHHRYGTAQMYRDQLAAELGGLPAEHPANYVLCAFCAMEDPGLLILPTHRVLAGETRVGREIFEKDAALRVVSLRAGTAEDAVAELAEHGPRAVGLAVGGETQFFAIVPKNAGILDAINPERSAAWRALGLSFLHSYLIDRVVATKIDGAPKISYIKSAREAVAEIRGGGAAFLMQPTTMEELRGVCKAGDLMPQKSTYFYPKLASGMVVYSMDGQR